MSTPDTRPHTRWQAVRPEPDNDGRLFDPNIRRAVADMGRGKETVALEALTAIRLLAKNMHDEFQAWSEGHGLSESRVRVLMSIYYAPDRRLALGAIAESLSVVPRTITDLVDVLERDGLVVRVPDPHDRRSTLAELTDAGMDRIAAIRRSAVSQQAEVTKGLSEDELSQLRHLCLRVVQNMNERRGSN